MCLWGTLCSCYSHRSDSGKSASFDPSAGMVSSSSMRHALVMLFLSPWHSWTPTFFGSLKGIFIKYYDYVVSSWEPIKKYQPEKLQPVWKGFCKFPTTRKESSQAWSCKVEIIIEGGSLDKRSLTWWWFCEKHPSMAIFMGLKIDWTVTMGWYNTYFGNIVKPIHPCETLLAASCQNKTDPQLAEEQQQ